MVNKRILKSNNYSGHSCDLRVISDVHTKSVRNAIWSNEENKIISVSYDQSCALTQFDSLRLVSRFTHTNALTAVSNCVQDNNLVLIGSKNECLLWDTRASTKKAAKLFRSNMGQVIFPFHKTSKSKGSSPKYGTFKIQKSFQYLISNRKGS